MEIYIETEEIISSGTSILTEEEFAMMQNQDVYTVGYLEDFIPLSYMNENGEVSGTAVDTLLAIGNFLDIQFEFIEITADTPDNIGIDICLVPFYTTSKLTSQRSIAYYSVPYVMVYGSSPATNTDLPVGVLEYFEFTNEDIIQLLGDTETITYLDFDSMNAAFSAGNIQSMILTTARYNNIKNYIEDNDHTVDILRNDYECVFAYPADFSSEKIAIIDKVLAHIDTQTLSYSILTHSTYEHNSVTLSSLFKEHWKKILQILLVLIIFIITAISLTITHFEKRHKKTLLKSLMTDSVTELSTLHYFKEESKKLLKENPTTKYTIFSFDIDNFKYINEIYGHDIGTNVLFQIGEYLRNDQNNALIMSRIFADEFLIFLETEKIDFAFNQNVDVQKIAQLIELPHNDQGSIYQFSFSIGYYHISDPTLDISYMINCSRLAKDLGKNTVGYTCYEFTPKMALERFNNNNVVASMNTGVTDREFIIYYQPKVNLTTGKITGAEALVRWIRDGQMIPPNDFIPIFEKNGFIEILDYYVFTAVCQFIKANCHINLPVISVNISGVTVMKENFVDRLLELVITYEIKPSQLDLEITESALIHNFESAVEKIQHLYDLGFTISMDDFGVGISSLSRLKNIPLNTLKIDRGFIVDSLKSQKGATIVTHIILMAKALNLETVAEGLETKAQVDFFEELGCDVGQGYYYSRPLPEDEFLELL